MNSGVSIRQLVHCSFSASSGSWWGGTTSIRSGRPVAVGRPLQRFAFDEVAGGASPKTVAPGPVVGMLPVDRHDAFLRRLCPRSR